MLGLSWPTLIVAAAFVLAACGSDSSEATAYDPQGAESCAEIAEMFVGSHQRVLEALGTRTDADMQGDLPADLQAAAEESDEWFNGSAGERADELCPGGEEEFVQYVCEDLSLLNAQGEAGERYLRDNVPTCD